MNNDFLVNIENFQGPLDLLLFLIKKNEIDIYDIPIAKITNEYLETINLMKEMNLEVAGEFLLMASTLIYIKGRVLLPKQVILQNGEEYTEDPRIELVNLLSEYQKFQEMGKELGSRQILGRDVFKHPKHKISKSNKQIENLDLIYLLKAYHNISDKFKRIKNFSQVSEKVKSISDKILEIKTKYPNGAKKISLEDILSEPSSRMELIVSFLTILELAKIGYIRIFQHEDDIFINVDNKIASFDHKSNFNEL